MEREHLGRWSEHSDHLRSRERQPPYSILALCRTSFPNSQAPDYDIANKFSMRPRRAAAKDSHRRPSPAAWGRINLFNTKWRFDSSCIISDSAVDVSLEFVRFSGILDPSSASMRSHEFNTLLSQASTCEELPEHTVANQATPAAQPQPMRVDFYQTHAHETLELITINIMHISAKPRRE